VSENRRIATRHPVSIPVTVTAAGATVSCNLSNLSLGGAFLDHQRLPMGERAHLLFKLPGHDDPIDTNSTVRWSTSEGIGVQFDGLRARDVWALNRFFEQLRSSR
jgi:PilZ domain